MEPLKGHGFRNWTTQPLLTQAQPIQPLASHQPNHLCLIKSTAYVTQIQSPVKSI